MLLALTLAQSDCPMLIQAQVTRNGQLDLALVDAPAADAHTAVVAWVACILHTLATLEGDGAATVAARVISS